MPKKKVTTITEMEPDTPVTPSTEEIPFDMETLELTERLETIRQSLGQASDGILIKVYRNTSGKNPAFCFSDKTVDEEKIQSRCGAGSFLCNVLSNGKVIDSIEIDIDESAVKTPTDTKSPTSNDPIVTLLMQQNAQFMQAFTQMMVGGGQQKNTMSEIIDAVKSLKDLSGGSDPVAMKMFEKGIDLATKVSGFGEKSWTSEVIDAVKEVAKPLIPALMANAGKMQPNPNQPQLTQPPETLMSADQQRDEHLRQAISVLKAQALQNVSVGLVLDWIMNHATEYATLIRVVISSDFADIAKLDADIAREPLSTWFKTLYDGLRSEYQQSSSMDDDSTGEDGNDDNDSENGADSAPIVVEPEVVHISKRTRKH